MRVCARPRGTANWLGGRVSGLLRGFLAAPDGLTWARGGNVYFQTAGGPGEPKGNGAANRFPFSSTDTDYSEQKAKVQALLRLTNVQLG